MRGVIVQLVLYNFLQPQLQIGSRAVTFTVVSNFYCAVRNSLKIC